MKNTKNFDYLFVVQCKITNFSSATKMFASRVSKQSHSGLVYLLLISIQKFNNDPFWLH